MRLAPRTASFPAAAFRGPSRLLRAEDVVRAISNSKYSPSPVAGLSATINDFFICRSYHNRRYRCESMTAQSTTMEKGGCKYSEGKCTAADTAEGKCTAADGPKGAQC